MTTSRHLALCAAGILTGLTSCDAGKPAPSAAASATPAGDRERPGNQSVGRTMKVTIGSRTFAATLDGNPAAAALGAMLPLTLDMSELNGNEKFSRLAAELPADAASPGTIRSGDLMLWQTDTLVIFYETFRTSNAYTRLGRIDDPAGLAEAVGSGRVAVRFERE